MTPRISPQRRTASWRARRTIALLAMAALLQPLLLLSTSPNAEAQGGPFGCAPGFYQVIAGQLNEFDPATNLYRPIGQLQSKYNAMGYRMADGMMYAVQNNKLIRIDSGGSITQVGILQSGLGQGAYTGDFDDEGLLHLARGGREWVKINVDTLEVTPIAAFSGNRNVNDITNVNGMFYGASGTGRLWIYNPATLTVTDGGQIAGISGSNPFGAAWSTAGGNLYIGRNNGPIYQVTGYSTGNPAAVQVATAQSTSSNDGGSCGIAAPPPGVLDIDGPISETPPSTPEGAAAAAAYEQQFEQLQQESLQIIEESGGEPPAEAFEIDDAGFGEGPSCGATVDEDRLPREVVLASTYGVETTLFSTSFSGTDKEWIVLSGLWNQTGGDLQQLQDCGYDYTALLQTAAIEYFRYTIQLRALDGINHGGMVFNQSAEHTRSGAMIVDLANAGQVLRWGYYDALGYYQYLGGTNVDATGNQSVSISVEVRDTEVDIFFNGAKVGETTAANAGGHIGVVSSLSAVAFESAELVALPPG